jgi:DNA-binding NarL/FixJ family response regulator
MKATNSDEKPEVSPAANDVDLLDAQAVYRLLATHPGRTVEELAELTDLPTDRAKAAGMLLSKWGLATRNASDGWVAVDPDTALVTSLSRHQAAAEHHMRLVRNLGEQVGAIVGVFRPEARRQSDAGFFHYPGRAQRDQALHDLQTSTQETTDSMHRGEITVGMDVLERSLEVDREAVARGIRLRAIYPSSMLNHPQHAAYLRDLAAAGINVRLLPHGPVDMVIFDGHSVLLPGEPRDASRTMLILTGTAVRTFEVIYEDCWDRATPFGLVVHEAPDELDEAERTIASLMLSGLTDDQIARKMAITRRTLQRRIAKLMERWGAKSRFELGYHFARLDPAAVGGRETV